MTNLFTYTYDKANIQFEKRNGIIMVNATEMAKAFGKKVNHFVETDGTKKFIETCLKSRNHGFLNVEKREDLIISTQKAGTWMHRVLALKFAAWLDTEFELWVFSTIDHLLFGHLKQVEESLKQSAARRVEMKDLTTKLLSNEDFLRFQQLQIEEKRATAHRRVYNKKQLDVFQEEVINR